MKKFTVLFFAACAILALAAVANAGWNITTQIGVAWPPAVMSGRSGIIHPDPMVGVFMVGGDTHKVVEIYKQAGPNWVPYIKHGGAPVVMQMRNSGYRGTDYNNWVNFIVVRFNEPGVYAFKVYPSDRGGIIPGNFFYQVDVRPYLRPEQETPAFMGHYYGWLVDGGNIYPAR